MIFVTTGTQLKFDRLILSIDRWLGATALEEEVFAQIGNSDIHLKHLNSKKFLKPNEYEEIISRTTLLIGHAGTGTIITAHDHKIPLIIMPRRYEYAEHRNDHQKATVKKFKDTPGVYVAHSENELIELLNSRTKLKKCGEYEPLNRVKLISYLIKEISN